MNGMHGIIFAHQWHTGLRELTERRVPASVPFGGRYRFIDFMLSNMVNAGIDDVGVILSGSYQSLLDHVGSGKDWDLSRLHGGLRLLPPFSLKRGENRFRGKLDALAGVYSYLENIRQDHVVLSDSDIIANIDLREIYTDHLRSGADITAVCVDSEDMVEDGVYFLLDKKGNITDTASGQRQSEGYRALEIYILSTELLLRLVEDAMAHDNFSFRASVLQGMADRLKLRGYVWKGEAAQIRSLNGYYERSMELLDPKIRRKLFPPDRPIYTKERNDASTYLDPDGACVNSIVADGCTIQGTVENSILFRGVTVEKGAVVRDCILMQDVTVGQGASLAHIIADKNVQIGDGITLAATANCPMAVAKGTVV